jgi:uncharacterized protein YfbU (UPF0304 family)
MSETERLILIHLLRLRAQAEPEQAAKFNRQITILSYGFVRNYDELTDILDPPLADKDCKFVSDVLDMYRHIEWARQQYPELAQHPLARFPGFAQRDEGPLRMYALFILDTPENYEELQEHRQATDNFNSSCAMSDQYRSMLVRFRAVGTFGIPLSREQARTVLG